MTVTVDQPRIAWAHDIRTDQPLPAAVVQPWLAANGITNGRTVRVELLAGGTLRWWDTEPLPADAVCCTTTDAVYRNHLTGPHTTTLAVPLPPVLTTRDGST